MPTSSHNSANVIRSHQLPSSVVVQPFGEVNVRSTTQQIDVSFTLLMEPSGKEAEGWQTGVALDASGSMAEAYGRGLIPGPNGQPPKELLLEYQSRGWLKIVDHRGQKYPIPNDEAKRDLVARGHYCWSTNDVEPMARRMTAYLADTLDADGGTSVIYWACADGSAIEPIGELTSAQCATAIFSGPKNLAMGETTVLTPAVSYFAERYRDARRGMYIFVTDGALHDLEQVKNYTAKLCREIEDGSRNPIRCVLIGIGSEVNENQMEELDDLDTGTGVDLWDHKIAKEMRSLVEIFAEAVSEQQIVAPTARILDSYGRVAKNFSDGLPAKASLTLPADSKWFELEVAGQRIRQTVLFPG